MDAASITAITDNSGGSDNSAVGVAAAPVETDVSGGTTGVLSSSFDTSADTVMVSFATVLEQANLVLAEIGAGSVGEGPETGGGGTIAALDVSVANNTNDTDAMSFESFSAASVDILDAQATVIAILDRCRKAVGLAVLVVDSGGGSGQGEIASGEDIGTAAIANGAADDDAVNGILATEVDAWLVDLQDNIAYFATVLDEVTNVAADLPITHYAG